MQREGTLEAFMRDLGKTERFTMDEFAYRYNNRRNTDVFRTLLYDICFAIKLLYI